MRIQLTIEWQTFTLSQTSTGFGDDNSRVLFDMGGDQGGQVWLDDVSVTTADGTELVTNGNFQDGITGWSNGAAVAANITSYFAVAETTSSFVSDVNLRQIMTIVPDTAYTITFKAKSSIERTIIAGIGLNSGDYANSAESVSLTTEWQTFTLSQTSTGFGDDNSRVWFDMGGDQGGEVWIDDVSVVSSNSVDPVDPVDPETGDVGTVDNPRTLGSDDVINFNSSSTDIYDLFDFGDSVSAASTMVVDPYDTTNIVVRIVKNTDAPFWAGTTIARGKVIYPVTTENSTITVRVLSTKTGQVRLKLEESNDTSHSVETEAAIMSENDWGTLTFDFNNHVVGTAQLDPTYAFDTLSIFMDFGVVGDGSTYYIDDITFI